MTGATWVKKDKYYIENEHRQIISKNFDGPGNPPVYFAWHPTGDRGGYLGSFRGDGALCKAKAVCAKRLRDTHG